MAIGQIGKAIGRAMRRGESVLTDGQLLDRFVRQRDEAAFATLVRRHGPMVLGVCRRVLRHVQDAEDAFQAVFLVLVRKAAAITSRELLANWLFGVAHNTALKARSIAARRHGRERQVTVMPQAEATTRGTDGDLLSLLDQELSRLPEKYRIAIVLCDLEGKSHREAAEQLDCPQGTVSGRLVRARTLLARRLARRGVALSAVALVAALTRDATAGVPAALMGSTVKAANTYAASSAVAVGAIPAPVAALTERVLKSMLLHKLKTLAAVLVVVGAISLGAIGGILPATATDPPATTGLPSLAQQTGTAPVPPDSKSDDKAALPRGLAPTQAAVRLDGKQEKLVTRSLRLTYEAVVVEGEDGRVSKVLQPREREETYQCELSKVRVQDAKGRKIDVKDLPKQLKKETPALIAYGVEEIDPLHLRLYKEDTLVFLLPPRAEDAGLPGGPPTAPIQPPGGGLLPPVDPKTGKILPPPAPRDAPPLLPPPVDPKPGKILPPGDDPTVPRGAPPVLPPGVDPKGAPLPPQTGVPSGLPETPRTTTPAPSGTTPRQ